MSQQPLFLGIFFGRGIDPAPRKGITAQNAPCAEQNAAHDAEIVDAALGIFRTSGLVQTHPSGEIFLIETNAPDAKTFQNRPICLFRSEEHTSELQSRFELVWRLLLEKTRT